MGKVIRHRHRRFLVWLVVVFLLAAGRGLAQGPLSAWPAVLSSSGFTLPVASGILYSHFGLITSSGPLDIHHLRVDLNNPTVHLGVALAHNRLMSDDETVSSMVGRSGAIAGINADYFDIHESGMPLNILARDGQLLRSPWRFVAFALGKDGVARIVRFRWTGRIVLPDTGEARPLEGYNSGMYPDGVIAISNLRGYGAPPPDPGTRQTVVELAPSEDAGSTPVTPRGTDQAPVPQNDFVVVTPGPDRFVIKPAPSAPAPTVPRGTTVPSGAAGDMSGRYFVKQVWPQQAFYAPFPKDEIVLLGRGAGADWLARRVTAGQQVQVDLTTDPDWRDFQAAIGGGPVLIQNGQIVEDSDAPSPLERDHRHPVIAVGIARDGRSLTLVEVDGRQPNLSIGLTRPELASYLRWLGAYQAMAFDSGGSAEVVARLPGQSVPTVVNSPSDGRERPVANALLIYSTSVPGPATKLLVNGNRAVRLFVNAASSLSIVGLDEQGNPVPPPDDTLQVSASPPLASYADGMIRAGPAAGEGTLQVQSGTAAGTALLSVVNRLRRLVVSPESVSLVPGAGWTFALVGQDEEGHQVMLPDAAGTWAVTPPWLGTFSSPAQFVAGERAGAGTIRVSLGGAAADVRVNVGNRARSITQFDRGEWSFRGYPDTVTGAVALVSTPSREHHPSAQLAFRLDGPASKAAYLMTRLSIAGSPTMMTLWAYGDKSGVWLRGAYDQASGPPGTVTFARRVNWQGWRSLTAALPAGIAYPITWTSFYVVEPDPARTPHGVIYLSSPRAVYAGATK